MAERMYMIKVASTDPKLGGPYNGWFTTGFAIRNSQAAAGHFTHAEMVRCIKVCSGTLVRVQLVE